MAPSLAAHWSTAPHARHLLSPPCATDGPANPPLPTPRSTPSRSLCFSCHSARKHTSQLDEALRRLRPITGSVLVSYSAYVHAIYVLATVCTATPHTLARGACSFAYEHALRFEPSRSSSLHGSLHLAVDRNLISRRSCCSRPSDWWTVSIVLQRVTCQRV